MPSPILRQLNFPNAITLSGLMLTFLSAVFAVQGRFYPAILCMMYAGITDLFDGFVARRTERTELQAELGKQLDSLVDVCSFGFGPAVFAYCYGLRQMAAIALLMFYMGANALRLAYFNSVGMTSEGDEKYFTGMPVTYAALFIPIAFTASLFLSASTMQGVLAGLYLVLAMAMVSGLKIVKPRGVWYGVFGLVALVLTVVYAVAMATSR